MVIRRVRADHATDVQQYRRLRNTGLKDFPDAFTTTCEEGVATPSEKLARRFGGTGTDEFILDAFPDADELLGAVGFERETRIKQLHKGHVIGMFVAAAARGTGLGRKLLQALIEEALQMRGLEQISLSVARSNEGARRLGLSAGFATYGAELRGIKVGGVCYDNEFMALRL